MKYLQILLFLHFYNEYTFKYMWMHIIMQKNAKKNAFWGIFDIFGGFGGIFWNLKFWNVLIFVVGTNIKQLWDVITMTKVLLRNFRAFWDYFWPFLAIFCHFGHFWPFLAIFDYFWPFLTVFFKFGWVMVIYINLNA